LLLPLRLEYRVFEVNAPVQMAGRVAEMFRTEPTITIERTPTATPARPPGTRTRTPRAGSHNAWTLGSAKVTFKSRKEIWFRWFPDEDFMLRGIAPADVSESAALAAFDAAIDGRPWHRLNDPEVVSAWQVLSLAVA